MAILIWQNLPEDARGFWEVVDETWQKTSPLGTAIFCEFGASDGYTFSNTFMLEKVFGWTGLLIEPNSTFHNELSRNRNSKISTKVVGEKEMDIVFECDTENPFLSYIRTPDSRCSEQSAAKSTFSSGTPQILRAKSLQQILTEFDMGNIFFLGIDVEGMELDILRSGFLENWSFGFVTVETNGRNNESDIFSIMEDSGYIRLAGISDLTGGDDWFVNKTIIKHLPATLLK